MKRNNQKLTKLIAVILTLMVLTFTMPVKAAALTSISDTMTRQMESQASSHDILFTLSGGNTFQAGETITIDFNEDGGGFSLAGAASVVGDFDFNDGTERVISSVTVGAPSCSAGVNNVAVGINDTTGIVTFEACSTYTQSASGATINIEYGTVATTTGTGTNRVTNPATAGVNTTFVVPVTETTDSGSFAVVITDTTVGDQVVLTASVDPSITFSLSANASTFGSLAPGVVDTANTNITLTVGTNGNGGYNITVNDSGSGSNPGLYNSLASALIASANADLASGGTQSGYGLQVSCTAGCSAGDIAADWKVGGDTVGGLTLAPKNVVTYATSTSANHTLDVVHKAKASASTKAGSYTDTLTYVATATF